MAAKQTPLSERRAHVEAWRASELSAEEYAAEHGIVVGTLKGWYKEYNKDFRLDPRVNGDARATVSSSTVKWPDYEGEIAARDELIRVLRGQLEDEKTKVASLQNVIFILGHQVGST